MATSNDKLREALEEAKYVLQYLYKPELSPIDGDNRRISEAVAKIVAALSAPRLNCEVGTAEEQKMRYDEFCRSHIDQCLGECECPLYAKKDCKFAWAQLPYEEGGAK